MTDYSAYIPVVNRFDLLDDAVKNSAFVHDNLTIIDNSPNGLDHPYAVKVFRPEVPFTFSQSMNYEFRDTLRQGKKFCLHMHSDSVVPKGAINALLDHARLIDESGRKWGVIYTLYDIMAVYNPVAALAIGGYDTILPAYFSDNDYYYRLKLAGWELLETGIEVGHIGSQTINSDPKLKFLNGVTFPLYRHYYIQKWGGEPGHEEFTRPFDGAN